jgi:hypothetical protein
VGLLTLAVTIAMLIALIRHVFVLGRAAGRFNDEVGGIAKDISEQADRASSRVQAIPGGGRRGSRG